MSKYKILIVAPAWVGDMVMGQTLLKLLKRQYGDNCQIDVLVNDWAKDVAKRMPEVARVFLNPFKHGEFGLVNRIKLGLSLRKEKYDQTFVLPNSLKSAFIPFFAGIKRRTGFVGEMRYGLLNDVYKLDKHALPLMIDRFCALANNGHKPTKIDYPEFSIDKDNQNTILNQFGLTLDKPIVCICPAAEYGPAKRWPTKHFADLANMLDIHGYQTWIMGSVKDQEIADEIIAFSSGVASLTNLCGKTNLVDVFDILAMAKTVVSNDSGLMHIACAVGAPVVALYGSSSPDFTPPLAYNASILKIDIECAPCFERTCKFAHYNCLWGITPQAVFDNIIKLSS